MVCYLFPIEDPSGNPAISRMIALKPSLPMSEFLSGGVAVVL